MKFRKSYRPHCPAKDCKGGRAEKLYETTAEATHLPPEISAHIQGTQAVYRCLSCGFVWLQDRASRPGFQAVPLGWWNNFRWPHSFRRVDHDYPVH
jgi:hypothetical protein